MSALSSSLKAIVKDNTPKLSKIVHIITDEKFIDMAFREFEAVAPRQNILVMIGENKPLRYVRNKEVRFYSLKHAIQVISSNEYAAVVFHSLGDVLLLKDIPNGKKVFWLGWGYDYYDRLLAGAYPDGLILPMTRSLLFKVQKRGKLRTLLSIFRAVAKRILGRSFRYSPVLSRIDYFSPVLDIEYQMARELNPSFKPDYICWNYGTVEDDLCNSNADSSANGENILIGNNATPENNHLEVFELITKYVDLTGRKIFVPLSYGPGWYKEKIVAAGHQFFGGQFVPLTDFMPKDAYIELLNSCGYVFMNHLRQQALGNVCIMMLKGAKIYINPKNPLYNWLSKRGAIIHSIDELMTENLTKLTTLTPLSSDAQQKNCSVVKNHWGRDAQRKKTRQLIDIALGAARC